MTLSRRRFHDDTNIRCLRLAELRGFEPETVADALASGRVLDGDRGMKRAWKTCRDAARERLRRMNPQLSAHGEMQIIEAWIEDCRSVVESRLKFVAADAFGEL